MDKGVARIPDARTTDNEGRTRHVDSGIAGSLEYYSSTLSPREYGYRAAPKMPGRMDERPSDGIKMKDSPDHSGDRDSFATRLKRTATGWFGHR